MHRRVPLQTDVSDKHQRQQTDILQQMQRNLDEINDNRPYVSSDPSNSPQPDHAMATFKGELSMNDPNAAAHRVKAEAEARKMEIVLVRWPVTLRIDPQGVPSCVVW